MKGKKLRRPAALAALILMLAAAAFGIYVSAYYRADAAAADALISDDAVSVSRIDSGYFFDGPSADTALVFYPGGKVEETAYAPLLHRLAAGGIDVFLVSVPFHLAVFDIDAAGKILEDPAYAAYDRWYVGGHSLGGVMSAEYAAKHADMVDGVILCAAYPVSKLGERQREILIYGSHDEVLNIEKVNEAEPLAPKNYLRYVIEGGNHAQFGNYGAQRGDGAAEISAKEQQEETVRVIREALER